MTTTLNIPTMQASTKSTAVVVADQSVNHNDDQKNCLAQIDTFLKNAHSKIFILKGQAGTGKTTLISDIKKLCDTLDYKAITATPTGRAAQVISNKIGMNCSTIHSLIYSPYIDKNSGIIDFRLKEYAFEQKTVFVIDEASMVSDTVNDTGKMICRTTLLNDLLSYANNNTMQNKIIFIGDPYQLPPVGSNNSPALDAAYMAKKTQSHISQYELKEVMRQKANSPVLKFATQARMSLKDNTTFPAPPFAVHASSNDFTRNFLLQFDRNNLSNAVIVCMSNKAAFVTNSIVRERMYNKRISNYPVSGDAVMVNQNWFSENIQLYNGTTGIIESVDYNTTQIVAGLTFAKASIIFRYNKVSYRFRKYVLLDVFDSEDGSISMVQEKALYHHANKVNEVFRKSQNTWDDQFLGALRIRYAYAITCHKAQGGEWKHVFVNPYYNQHDHRWLYTAITRAETSVHTFLTPQAKAAVKNAPVKRIF